LTAAPAPAAQRRPEDVAFSMALGMVAFLPRLFVAIAWAREPVWDGHYYHLGASRIATINDRAHARIPALQTFAATQTRRWAHLRLGHARSKQIANLLHCVSIGILP